MLVLSLAFLSPSLCAYLVYNLGEKVFFNLNI